MATKYSDDNKNENLVDINNRVSPSTLKKIIEIELDSIKENPDLVKTYPPILIHGSPGIGKSTVVRELCRERGIEFIDFRASQCEPADIRGLPVPNREQHSMEWFVNGVWPRNPNGRGIIFLDEIMSCDRSIQVSLYQLILDRCLGDLYHVPDGYLIVAAGNNVTDRAVVSTMSSALANRFMHLELDVSSEDWIKWGTFNGIHPSVMGYIRFRPENLFNMTKQNLERGWPSPRSWEFVSRMCHTCKDETVLRKMVYGLVGNAIGCDFMEFKKMSRDYDDVLTYMLDPSLKLNIPTDAGSKYALVSALVYHVWRGENQEEENMRVDGFFRIINQLTSDFATMAITSAGAGTNLKSRSNAYQIIFQHPLYKVWASKFGKNLKKHFDFD